MKTERKKTSFTWELSIFIVLLIAISGCSGKKIAGNSSRTAGTAVESSYDIAVFIPGVIAGSPLYQQMVAGAREAAAGKKNIKIKVLEAGFNQGEWKEKLMSLAAEKKYELIVSENGAMPYVALPVAKAFPDQKFLFVDAAIKPQKQMYTLLYNQVEEGYLIGYLGGMITKSSMKGANADLKIGIIAGQEFPAMTQMIVPGYKKGAAAADSRIKVDYRVLGNWYDANKARELAKSMIDSGVDVILTICGGANQGVITAAKENGIYVLYFDSEKYDLAPGTIAGCVILEQKKAVSELILRAYAGTLPWGTNRIVGVKEGYVRFADTNPLYLSTIPETIRKAVNEKIQLMKDGKLTLPVPDFWKN